MNRTRRFKAFGNKDEKEIIGDILNEHDKQLAILNKRLKKIEKIYKKHKKEPVNDKSIKTPGNILYCPYCGHEILNSVNTEKGKFKLNYHCDYCKKEFTEGIINVNEIDDIWLPVTNALVRVNVIYKDPIYEDPESKEYGKIPPTNNEFAQYNPDYEQMYMLLLWNQ